MCGGAVGWGTVLQARRSRIDSWWGHCDFSMTSSFWLCYGLGVYIASNRNEYQRYLLGCKGGQCIGLTTLSPSFADFLEILGASKSWSPKACPVLYRDCITLPYHILTLSVMFHVSNGNIPFCFRSHISCWDDVLIQMGLSLLRCDTVFYE